MTVLSGNIFNAETPGYRSKTFNIHFDTAVGDLMKTNERHLSNSTSPTSSFSNRNSGNHLSADGNDVSLAQEQSDLAQTVADFNVSLSMFRDRLTMLDRVITGR